MAEETVTVATPGEVPTPISASLGAAIDRMRTSVPAGKRIFATGGVSTSGVEAGIGYTPKAWLSVGGYAARLWGGGWTAGARCQIVW